MTHIIYHPGTGTVIAADECVLVDIEEIEREAESFDDVLGDDTPLTTEETLTEVDAECIDLGMLVQTLVTLKRHLNGTTVSKAVPS